MTATIVFVTAFFRLFFADKFLCQKSDGDAKGYVNEYFL